MIWPLIALLAAGATEPTCRTSDRRVENVIAAKAKELGGSEYCQSRLYHTIDDIDGDDKDDFILVFTIEAGGNNSTQHLAVFPSSANWKAVVLKVGQGGERFIDDVDVDDDGIIVLTTAEYQEGDPACCPSDEGELRYKFLDGRLIPLPGAPPNRALQLTRAAPARR